MDGDRAVSRRADELSAQELTRLRPYVVNLTQGRFSTGGRLQTTKADVDAIFDRHLPAAVAAHDGGPLPLALWAHGGLISESSGLRIALDQIDWWLQNGVYPLHFVWESGLLDAVGQVVRGALPGQRDIWDVTTDPLIETVAAPLGSRLWLAMKSSATLASAPDGGARYVAERLGAFVDEHPEALSVHAVGHSAGSIFHAHFLPAALTVGVPRFDTVQFLAPAVRVDEFRRRLQREVGERIGALTVYTMRRELERDDSCLGLYRKSLLYLVQRSFEPVVDTPILGLEDSLLDGEIADFFGLSGTAAGPAEVVWSVTDDGPPEGLSGSTSHGGFDNDRLTMGSVVRRVTGRTNVLPLPAGTASRGRQLWSEAGQPAGPVQQPSSGMPGHAPAMSSSGLSSSGPSSEGGGGRRRALCVGIDRYPTSPLAGCVADARGWSSALRREGFDVTLLLDEDATRAGILAGLDRLMAGSVPGDVLVLQYAGHGTEVPDESGDETEGLNGPRDEALCPVDYAAGHLLIDDELDDAVSVLPAGVAMTVFLDCCHSGSAMRFTVSEPLSDPGLARRDVRARWLPADDDLVQAHLEFRRGRRSRRATGLTPSVRTTLFSASLDHEVAYETDGQGDFTRRALQALGDRDERMTNDDFLRRVLVAFGHQRRQTPNIDRPDIVGQLPFLMPVGPDAPSRRAAANGRGSMQRQ
jgi:hypothetical protein